MTRIIPSDHYPAYLQETTTPKRIWGAITLGGIAVSIMGMIHLVKPLPAPTDVQQRTQAQQRLTALTQLEQTGFTTNYAIITRADQKELPLSELIKEAKTETQTYATNSTCIAYDQETIEKRLQGMGIMGLGLLVMIGSEQLRRRKLHAIAEKHTVTLTATTD
ncbi:MAG TPA: hypothetical protein VJB87_01260 [Candidatus Nanoarchaeia archaeon]|nr:hypothetical protein [Candidatus Nanoarchaeia archaeon]